MARVFLLPDRIQHNKYSLCTMVVIRNLCMHKTLNLEVDGLQSEMPRTSANNTNGELFVQSSTVQFSQSVPIITTDSCSWQKREEPDVIFCCNSLYTTSSDVLCMLRCYSFLRSCKIYLSKLLQMTCQGVQAPVCVNSIYFVPRKQAVSEIFKPAHQVPTTMPQLKSQKSYLFPFRCLM